MHRLEELLGLNVGDIKSYILTMGTNFLLAILIFVAGFWLARILSKGLTRLLRRQNTDESLVTFFRSLTSILLKVLVIITAITQLGVEMTSFVALLGAAGLAIGMAFSGTLSNFAGGVMILMFKPFKVGDFVEVQGEQGTVKEVLIFNTILTTTDNKIIILPNGPVANGTIINFTKADKRRIEWTFGISYGDDLKAAKGLLYKFIEEEKRIIRDPEPFVGVGALAESSVNLIVRVWVETDDYWPVYFEMNERAYNEFAMAGITIPFPQMEVHIKKES